MKAPHFLPLNLHKSGTGNPVLFIKDRDNIGLTSEKARYTYKNVEKIV